MCIIGDRCNVLVKESDKDSGVYLYSHWAGSEMPKILSDALKRGTDRWDDSQYLPRIIFCEMVKGSEMDTTGYGISTFLGDGADRILEVNVDNQTVSFGKTVFPFQKFVELSEAQLAKFWYIFK